MNKIIHAGPRTGSIHIPSSKSVVHRLLICSALSENPTLIHFKGLSRDIEATVKCLQSLGSEITINEQELFVTPINKNPERICGRQLLLEPGESGSTLRFLIPIVGALGVQASFIMEGRLPERPLEPFDRLLMEHGMKISREGSNLRCSGSLRSGNYELQGNVSSQYFSGLLMALPLLSGTSTLRSNGTLESVGYVSLTEQILQKADIAFETDMNSKWLIPGCQHFRMPSVVDAEGDWSNAAFFLCLGALSSSGLCVSGLNMHSSQGDRAVIHLLKDFGAEVQTLSNDTVFVRQRERQPICVDATNIPDLVPVLAVLCCGANGTSIISGAARLRLKESDRLRTTANMIIALGGSAEEYSDGLIIHGCGKLRSGTVDASNDHRIAMSSAVAACLCDDDVIIFNAECVNKSYPAFFEDFDTLNNDDGSPAIIQEKGDIIQ